MARSSLGPSAASAQEWLDAERRAALERDQARSKAKFLAHRLEISTQQLVQATSERDEYARIASTHELQPRHFEKGRWVRKV